MKQLIVTSKVVSDFVEQPPARAYKTYCPKCTFVSSCEADYGAEITRIDYTCHISGGYPSLCEGGTIGFYRYNVEESIKLTDEARDEFHY
jgi:hypothetical protein